MKKLLAIFICLSMLVSLSVVTQAEEASMFITDEFDTDSLGVINPVLYRGTYAGSDGVIQGSQTDVFGASLSKGGDTTIFEIIKDGAYQGNALKVTKPGVAGSKYNVGLIDVAGATDESPVFVNFKLKILEDGWDGETASSCQSITVSAGGGNILYIKENGGAPKMWPNNDTYLGNGTTRFNYALDQWYDVMIEYTTGNIYVTVKDDQGNVATGQRNKTSNAGVLISSNTAEVDSTIIVDEFYMVQGAGVDTQLDETSLPENIDTMSRMPEFNLAFNQPVFADNASVSIVDSQGTAVNPADIAVSGIGFDAGVNIAVTEMLAKGETYTLTLSGVENLSGVASGFTFNFTTEVAHTFTLENKARSVVSEKTQVDVNFGNTLGYASTPVRVMGVVYDNGKMASLEYKTGTVDVNGDLSVVFDTIAPTQSFSLLVFDDANTLIPVIEAISFE